MMRNVCGKGWRLAWRGFLRRFGRGDLFMQVSPDGSGPTEARPPSPKEWKRVQFKAWAATASEAKRFAAQLGAGVSVFVGFWDGAAHFVSPYDGEVAAVPPDAWLVEEDTDKNYVDFEVVPGDYGDLVSDGHHVIFDRNSFGTLWGPGEFEVTKDQRSFRRKTKKGHAADDRYDIEIRSVLDDPNLAHRFATEGYLLVNHNYGVGFVIGSSLGEWQRTNRR